MEYFSKSERTRFDIGRAKDDPEKSIFPTLIYINLNDNFFEKDRAKGFLFILGWWDYYIKFGMFL